MEDRLYLLQVKLFAPWQIPFHFAGVGSKPSSLKLGFSGQTPAKITETDPFFTKAEF
jgi:hypothetical protein